MTEKPTYEELLKKIKTLEEEKATAEDQLRQAKKLEGMGTLAGLVAHNLNNILSGIVTYPDLILMDLPEDSPFKKPVKAIKDCGENAAVLIQEFLTLARGGDSTSGVLNLNEVITELKNRPEFQKIKIFQPGVKIIFELEMPLYNIKGSSALISKSILNLITNAAESIEDRGRINVLTANKYIDTPQKVYQHMIPKGQYVTVSIEDTGKGISETDLLKIFEPFYTKKIMGRKDTGLGMPVVWWTMKDHNGFIDIKTAEERGTAFTLYFPVLEDKNIEN